MVHQDALLTQFELTVAALVPLTPVTTEHDLRVNFVDGIIMQALSARLDALQQVDVYVSVCARVLRWTHLVAVLTSA